MSSCEQYPNGSLGGVPQGLMLGDVLTVLTFVSLPSVPPEYSSVVTEEEAEQYTSSSPPDYCEVSRTSSPYKPPCSSITQSALVWVIRSVYLIITHNNEMLRHRERREKNVQFV